MRRVFLVASFFALLAALHFLWQHRFEPDPRFPAVVVSHPPLRVLAHAPPPVTRIELPEFGAVTFLHVRCQLAARGLQPGPATWQDGRCMLEWRDSPDSPTWENDPVTTVRHDEAGPPRVAVFRPKRGPAYPSIRLENLGIAGEFQVVQLRAEPLRERLIWKFGRWLLALGWLGWAAACATTPGSRQRMRPILAGAVWLFCCFYFVVPGPWKSLQPLVSPFQITPATHEVFQTPLAPPIVAETAAALPSVGKLPDAGDFTLRIKHALKYARPLLHALLLFAPALAIACLVGPRRMLPLAILFALAIEAAQTAFGYGFGLDDVFDLACDAVGIVAALWFYRQLTASTRFPRLAATVRQPPLPLQ